MNGNDRKTAELAGEQIRQQPPTNFGLGNYHHKIAIGLFQHDKTIAVGHKKETNFEPNWIEPASYLKIFLRIDRRSRIATEVDLIVNNLEQLLGWWDSSNFQFGPDRHVVESNFESPSGDELSLNGIA